VCDVEEDTKVTTTAPLGLTKSRTGQKNPARAWSKKQCMARLRADHGESDTDHPLTDELGETDPLLESLSVCSRTQNTVVSPIKTI
jgi:hypothetical protein